MIEFRWLDWEDLKLLDVVLESKGIASLNQATSRGLGIFDGEQLVGFCVLQLFPLLGPLWLDPTYRGQGLAEQVADKILEFLNETNARGYIAIADSPHTNKLCERIGMHKLDSPVFIA